MRDYTAKILEEAYKQVTEMSAQTGPRPEQMTPEQILKLDPAIASKMFIDLNALSRLSDEQIQAYRKLATYGRALADLAKYGRKPAEQPVGLMEDDRIDTSDIENIEIDTIDGWKDKESPESEVKNDEKINKLYEFIRKNIHKIHTIYLKYGDKDMEKDPDVRTFINYNWRRGDPREFEFYTGRRARPGIDIPDRTRSKESADLAPYIRGMLKIIALQDKSLARKIYSFTKNIFRTGREIFAHQYGV